jgi:choline dehydrogenase
MIYMRGQEGDYASWVKATGDDAWSWENALQRYKEFEDYHGAASQWHGKGGEWTVSKQRLRWPIMDIFREAAVEAGIPASDDFNQGDNFGVGYFDVSQRKGWRLNTSKAFLRDAAKRPNLTVITEAMVNKLLIDSNSKNCYGVQFIKDGKVSEVILSAGTIGSVQVLERSGIGSAAHLNKLGIPVVADLPGVGENLQDHLQLRMIYKVSGIKTLNTKANSLLGKLMIGMEYVFKRSGPMSMAPSQLGAFAYSSPDQPSANVEYHVQPLSLEKFGEDLHSFNAITASVCNLRPTSRGSVHISSIDPEVPPMIAPNYLSTNEDRKVAVDSLRLTRKIVESPALKPYTPEEYKPGKQYQSDDELIKAAGDIGTTIFHPVGTCKMGLDDDPMAVLDSQLRVRGIHHLRVVDASAMPTITSGNTAAPTMMIAQRAAQLLTGE